MPVATGNVYIGILLLLSMALVVPPSYSLDTVTVVKSGRRIQLDGFLLDWGQKGRSVWKGANGWVWDAVNTPEGVAGYFHCGMVACSSWTFYADLHRLTTEPWVLRLGDSAQKGDSRYAAIRTGRDGRYAVTFEWLLPWDSLSLDSMGRYAVHVVGESGCGDTLKPFLLRGTRTPPPGMLPPRFTERIIVIVVLLAVFIGLQIAVRKKSRRRGSLRRSA